MEGSAWGRRRGVVRFMGLLTLLYSSLAVVGAQEQWVIVIHIKP